MDKKFISFRKYAIITNNSARVVGKVNKVWKFARQYRFFLINAYKKINIIAKNKGIILPNELTQMED
jgi:hypothetical protein